MASLKNYLITAAMVIFGKNVQAQDAPSSATDNDGVKTQVKAPEKSVSVDDSTYVIQSKADTLQTQTANYKKRPTIDVSKADKLAQVWLKTKEGKQAINDYIDALTSVMPKAKLPESLSTDDVYALKAMQAIPAEERCIGMFPDSDLQYDTEDLLSMQPDMAQEIEECSKNSLKPENWRSGNCLQGFKNTIALLGLESREGGFFDLGSAYQAVDYLRNSESFQLRELKNGWKDTDKLRTGTGGVAEKGTTKDSHIWWAITYDNKTEAVYVNEYGEACRYIPAGERSDKEYSKSNTTGQRGRTGQHYGTPYVIATNKTVVSERTLAKELVNEEKKRQTEEFRQSSIAIADGVPEFDAPTPKKMLELWTDIKSELLTENGNINYVRYEPFNRLKLHPYKRSIKKGGNRFLAQKRNNNRHRSRF